jgi:broad specificity phosphatase PhoE
MDPAPTTVLLVRHGHAEPVDRWLAGRRAGIPLSARGRLEVTALADALRAVPRRPTAVYSSPLERAWETAQMLAAADLVAVVMREAFTEIEYGAWTGKTLGELNSVPAWHAYNTDREHSRPPGGESLAGVQARALWELGRARSLHPGEVILVVSHADVIRAVLAHYTQARLNDAQRFTVDTASVTTLELGAQGGIVLGVNQHATEIAATLLRRSRADLV